MDRSLRRYFDKQVDKVLAGLPGEIHEILEVIPLHVDDRPSKKLMKEMKIENREELCGCFVGHTITESRNLSGVPLGYIVLFRKAIYSLAMDEEGFVDPEELREQIRITILHEIGHYHGIDEDELAALGYG